MRFGHSHGPPHVFSSDSERFHAVPFNPRAMEVPVHPLEVLGPVIISTHLIRVNAGQGEKMGSGHKLRAAGELTVGIQYQEHFEPFARYSYRSKHSQSRGSRVVDGVRSVIARCANTMCRGLSDSSH